MTQLHVCSMGISEWFTNIKCDKDMKKICRNQIKEELIHYQIQNGNIQLIFKAKKNNNNNNLIQEENDVSGITQCRGHRSSQRDL